MQDVLTVDYRSTDGAFFGRMTAPVGITAQISRGAVAGRSPDFILDRREQLNELFSADPARKHLLWKGVGYLSAEVRLGATEECLLLSVDVTDDVHHPVEPAGGAWREDGVQFWFGLSGRKGDWELGLSCRADGSPAVWCRKAPEGWNGAQPAARHLIFPVKQLRFVQKTLPHDPQTIECQCRNV